MPVLYYKPTCFFCQKVLRFATENHLQLELRDILEDGAHATALIAHGGKRQVPYLIDEAKGISMYESDDIIAYLQNNYVH